MKARRSWIQTLSLTCRDATRLQSESLDHPLTFFERTGLRLHLFLCKWCRRYGQQVRFLRAAFRRADQRLGIAAPVPMPPAAREQLKARLRQEQGQPAGERK